MCMWDSPASAGLSETLGGTPNAGTSLCLCSCFTTGEIIQTAEKERCCFITVVSVRRVTEINYIEMSDRSTLQHVIVAVSLLALLAPAGYVYNHTHVISCSQAKPCRYILASKFSESPVSVSQQQLEKWKETPWIMQSTICRYCALLFNKAMMTEIILGILMKVIILPYY